METNKKMIGEDVVIETTEKIAKSGSGKGLKIAAGVGLLIIGGVFAYRYIAKPMIAKIKAKKEPEFLASDKIITYADNSKEELEEL